MSVDTIINGILEREGSAYTNDPKDSGGPTKFGVTQTTLARYRGMAVTPEHVEKLTRPEAFNVYNWLYVQKPGFDKLVAEQPSIGAEIIDIGVMSGPAVGALILQRLLNALNNEQGHYADLKADGDCGPATVAALRAYLARRGSEGFSVLMQGIRALKIARFVDIVEHRPKDERFLFGWIKGRGVVAS
jgi:lysozyme family protein